MAPPDFVPSPVERARGLFWNRSRNDGYRLTNARPVASHRMDCREFRNKHVGFVDDLLPAVEMDAMRRHVFACPRCARQDTVVRRSLLLVRNLHLPPIEPSAEFQRRLDARLAALGPVERVRFVASYRSMPSIGAFVALAAGMAAVAYMTIRTTTYFSPAPGPDAPIVASASRAPLAAQPAPIVPVPNAAFVASVPTGIPVWPAMLMVGDAPIRFANAEFSETNLTR